MTHNCQTILQPCLTPVTRCILPARASKRDDGSQSIAEKRDEAVCKLIKTHPGISQVRIAIVINVSSATVSKSLARLVDAGKIELTPGSPAANGRALSKNFYKIKEYLQ